MTGKSSVPFGEIVTLTLDTEIKHAAHGYLWRRSAKAIADCGIFSPSSPAKDTVRTERSVEILHIDGEQAYVRGTFQPGAEIVAGGTNRVVTGQRVALAGE